MSAKKITARLVQLPVEVQLAAQDGDQGPKKFTALAYSGSVVPKGTASPPLAHDYIFDLSGMKAGRSPKANLDHKPEQRVGHIEEVQNDGKQLMLAGKLSAATTYRDQVAESAKDGYQWEVSIEANMSKGSMDLLAAGKTAIVNGKTVTGPLFIVRKSQLTGIAFCSQGADDGNLVSIAASAVGDSQMTEFEKFVVSCGADPEAITDEHRATLQTAFDAMQSKVTTQTHRPFSLRVEAEKKEQERIEAIEKISVELMRNNRPLIHQIEEATQQAIESNMAPDTFELQMLRDLRINAGKFTVTGGRKNPDPKLIECALAVSANLPNIEKFYPQQLLEAVDDNGMRQFSLQELMMNIAMANGYAARPGERVSNTNIRSVLECCFPERQYQARLTGFSTISLPGILGNVANKEILAGYMESDTTWQFISSVKSVTNFYQHTRYRLLDSMEYEELGPTGEIKHGTVDQESYTTQAKTYAKMLAITREHIINDDLGAFDDIRERLGRGASKKFNNVVWAAFMNNASFYTSARTNYISGATTNLGTDGVGLGLGMKAWRKMTTPTADGTKRIGASLSNPRYVLVPPELEVIARQLNVGGNVAQTVGNTNVWANLFTPVVQNRLSDSAFTGNSTTAWYLLGDEMKPIAVTFLNGQQTPVVESAEADFNQYGIQIRGRHDFGADQAEYLGSLMSKGAA